MSIDMWAQIANILLGVWIMVVPAVLDFDKQAADNNYITGAIVITCGITSVWEVNRNVRYFTLLAGLWLIISTLMVSSGQTPTWNNVIVGAFICGLSMIKGKIEGHYGGGWRSLFQKRPDHLLP